MDKNLPSHIPSWLERSFVEYYLGEAEGNPSKAAMMCGFGPEKAYAKGQELLNNEWVRGSIEVKRKYAALPATELLARITATATFDPMEFYKWDDDKKAVVVNFDAVMNSPRRHAIKKFKKKVDGTFEIEFHNQSDAQEKLMRYHGLYAKDKAISIEQKNPQVLPAGLAEKIMELVAGQVPPELEETSDADD
jgi:hypothetical protein